MNKEIKPLYRRVADARNSHRPKGQEARYDRNTKKGIQRSMKKRELGFDHTPLYKFLLSKVGQDWDAVYSEAVSRLIERDRISDLVCNSNKRALVRCGESAMYSGLFIDDNNLLQRVNPSISNEMLYPTCHCCTHTFNGTVLVKTYDEYNKLSEEQKRSCIQNQR